MEIVIVPHWRVCLTEALTARNRVWGAPPREVLDDLARLRARLDDHVVWRFACGKGRRPIGSGAYVITSSEDDHAGVADFPQGAS